VHLHINM